MIDKLKRDLVRAWVEVLALRFYVATLERRIEEMEEKR